MTRRKAHTTKDSAQQNSPHQRATRRVIFSKRTVLLAGVAYALVATGIFWAPARSTAISATDCTISNKLVNSCRAWFGAHVYGYREASDAQSQYEFGEKRLNNPNVLINPQESTTVTQHYDVVHFYHKPDQPTLSDDEKTFANRPATYLYVNWKPDLKWAAAGGSNATVNGRIDQMANSIKSLGTKKLFLTVYHEPEDDVSKENCRTNSPTASAGSPTEYRKMWQNVRKRFDAKGVTNVVWVMNYMGWPSNNCLIPKLWPGNNLVDWISYDPYAGGVSTPTLFVDSVSPLYNYMTANSNSTTNYLSKPWALAEHGAWNKGGATQEMAIKYWKQAGDAVTQNTFPRLKMYLSFDTSVDQNWVGYDFQGQPNLDEQRAYNAFSQAVQTNR